MPVKVLMIGWELPPFYSGGLGGACLGLVKALKKKGMEITFVLPRKMDVHIDGVNLVFANVKEESSMNVYYTGSNEWSKLFSIDPFPPDFIKGALEYARKMYEIARKSDADIIHAHDWMTYPAAIVAKEVLGKPPSLSQAAKQRTFVVLGSSDAARTFFRSKGLRTSDGLDPLSPSSHVVVIWNATHLTEGEK